MTNDYWSTEYKQAILEEWSTMYNALEEIRDAARSNLVPVVLTEREYYQIKLDRIARVASDALPTFPATGDRI